MGMEVMTQEQAEACKIDKSTWGAGPWREEPDRMDFTHAGLACLAVRHGSGGHWCGYVGVPREHPAYGKKYEDVEVEFHGGLTYAGPCGGHICHVPAPGMPDDVWWMGGDFAHAWDFAPGARATLTAFGQIGDQVYRDMAYVRREIEALAEQLASRK